MMTTIIHAGTFGVRSIPASMISAAATMSLSASGSSSVPKVVLIPQRRAR